MNNSYSNLSARTLLAIMMIATKYDVCEYYYGGYGWTFMFANGRGVSVIKHGESYGSCSDLWELGVLDREGQLDYSTPITDDVIGYLDDAEVIDYCKQVSELP